MKNGGFTAGSPADQGYLMPPEWAKHQGTWLSFPRPEGISFPDHYDSIPAIWAEMTRILRDHEEVHINYFDDAHRQIVVNALSQKGIQEGENVFLHPFPAYEPWCRDHGPIVLKKGADRAIVDWGYNAWGGKYPPFDLDDAVPTQIAEYLKLPLFKNRTVMEGGSLDVNGEGTLLTTESCLLNPNRNPHLSSNEIEQQLKDYLGVTQILWLGDGIEGDDTDGHVDDLTRFVNPTTVVTILEEDPQDRNYSRLIENKLRLEMMTTAKGEKLQIIDLPTPGVIEREGQRLPASYANFYIANGVVLLPIFNHPNDKKAIDILQACFPSRRVVGIPSLDLIWGLGAYHCITQQIPA
ncbi:MAG: agmatine deiminase family protein [Verrucomicrobiota bacterium]